MIDRNFNFEEYVNNLRTKVSRANGFLKYSKIFLPQIALSKRYRFIGKAHFRFCCSVRTYCRVAKLLYSFQKLQNRTAGVVTKGNLIRFRFASCKLYHEKRKCY